MANYTTAKSRYNTLEAIRDPFLDRARDSAEFTIPSIMPREYHSKHSTLHTPYQGIGARGTNNLSSKLLLALLPPNQPFFRLTLDEFTLSELAGRDDMKGEFEKAMGSIERVVMNEMEVNNFRNALFEAIKHLIICGNVLLYITPDLKMKVYHLDRYVIKRDGIGNVLEIITKDMVAPSSLTEEQRLLVEGDKDKDGYDDTCEIYTCVKRSANGKKWEVHQEIYEKIIPSSVGTYPIDKNAFIPLRYTSIDNSDYGRGFIEEYIGDLRSLEALYRAVVEGSAAASKVLFLVKPNGSTRLKTLSESPNGAIREGNAEDVTTLQVNKFSDFNIAFQTMRLIEERLQFAFMLNTSVQRNNDRVTATEINYVSKELDDSLGGLYSLLSQELQLPLINRLMFQMERKKALPNLPKESVRPKIVTGLEALGRSSDLQRLNTFVQQLQPFADQLMTYLNLDEYVKRVGTSLGVEMEGLIKDPQQIQAEQQAMQEQMMMEQNSPTVVKEGMGMVRDSFKERAKKQ